MIELPAACCGNCVCWSSVGNGDDGECHFGPPTPLFMGFRPPALAGQPPQPIIGAAFPVIGKARVCRQWQPSPAEVPVEVDHTAEHGSMVRSFSDDEWICRTCGTPSAELSATPCKGANDA